MSGQQPLEKRPSLVARAQTPMIAMQWQKILENNLYAVAIWRKFAGIGQGSRHIAIFKCRRHAKQSQIVLGDIRLGEKVTRVVHMQQGLFEGTAKE